MEAPPCFRLHTPLIEPEVRNDRIRLSEKVSRGRPRETTCPRSKADEAQHLIEEGLRKLYPQVIEEWKAYGQLSGDGNEAEFAAALEQGFHSGGWKGALRKGIEVRLAQRKNGYVSAYVIADLYADLAEKDQAFQWLNTAYQERDPILIGNLKIDFLLDPLRSDPRFAELVRKVGLLQ